MAKRITGEDEDLAEDRGDRLVRASSVPMPSYKDGGDNDAGGVDKPATMRSDVTPQGIRPGDRIVIRYLDDNKTAAYTLSDGRNDPANWVLSVTSPLGKQVLGLDERDETKFEVAGRLRPILIVRVER